MGLMTRLRQCRHHLERVLHWIFFRMGFLRELGLGPSSPFETPALADRDVGTARIGTWENPS